MRVWKGLTDQFITHRDVSLCTQTTGTGHDGTLIDDLVKVHGKILTRSVFQINTKNPQNPVWEISPTATE